MSEFPKAYLRMSPNLDQHPDPLAMVKAMCAANRQPERGLFREAVVLERAVGRKAYKAMVQRGDIKPADPAPGIILAGWDDWQEGDLTVAERMRRMRAKKKDRKRDRVTPPASPDRNAVTTTATSSTSSLVPETVGVDDSPPPPAGRRKNGTNPRAQGTNPRATGSSPRQVRKAEKSGPTGLGAVLRRAAEIGRPA